MTEIASATSPAPDTSTEKPRFLVLDTNLIIRLLILEFGVRRKVSLFAIAQEARVSLVLTQCQKDEFWRNAPQVWHEHLGKWRGISGTIKSRVSELVDAIAAAQTLLAFSTSLLEAAEQIRRSKTVIEQVPIFEQEWEDFEKHAAREFDFYDRVCAQAWFDEDEVNALARRRLEARNPPCNDKKMPTPGDCVIWESVLKLAARLEGPVWLATMDSDFGWPGEPRKLHPFLRREVERSGGSIELFHEDRNLGLELRTQYRVLKALAGHLDDGRAESMEGFLRSIAAISPELSWRDLQLALADLSYREREILKLRLGIGDGYSYTQEEVGYIFRLSQPRISQIEAVAKPKLLQALKEAGDADAELRLNED